MEDNACCTVRVCNIVTGIQTIDCALQFCVSLRNGFSCFLILLVDMDFCRCPVICKGVGKCCLCGCFRQVVERKAVYVRTVPVICVRSLCFRNMYDEVITIENDDAFAEGRAFATSEGILVGISSGAALKAASILAKRPENKGKTIVVLLPDSGDRYLSTALFNA